MRRGRGKKRLLTGPYRRLVLMAVLLGVFVVCMILLLRARQKGDQTRELVQEGREYLASIEDRDAETIDSDIQEIRKEMTLQRLVESDAQEGETLWEIFEQALIIGDSRALGFSQYEWLPKEKVLAETGMRLEDIAEKKEEIVQANPVRIFLCIGLNDVGLDAQTFAANMDEVVQQLQGWVPGCLIYINSILPVTQEAAEKNQTLANATAMNEALFALCTEKQYYFIDNDDLADQHKYLYDTDGIHVKKDFYSYWAANMLLAVQEHEVTEEVKSSEVASGVEAEE